MDLTTGELTPVNWPGYPAMHTVNGHRIYQIRFWAHNEDSWVTLGAATPTVQTAGNLERTMADHFQYLLMERTAP